MNIYSEDYVRGRIYSFLNFKKYMKKVADIVCEEFQHDKNDIIEVSLSDDGTTVWIHFDSGTVGFASELLWDKNVRETIRKIFEVD